MKPEAKIHDAATVEAAEVTLLESTGEPLPNSAINALSPHRRKEEYAVSLVARRILKEHIAGLEQATATSARLLDFFIGQCQGSSGAGEGYWEQFPQYKIAQAYVARFKLPAATQGGAK